MNVPYQINSPGIILDSVDIFRGEDRLAVETVIFYLGGDIFKDRFIIRWKWWW